MSETGKIALKVVGVSYNQISNDAYALVLQEADGPRRIPVVIGQAEAYSIFMSLQDIQPPRPITHDLMVALMRAHGITLEEAFINRFADGMFMSELVFAAPDGQKTRIDSRTSDAVALAMRTGAPIYTTPQVIDATGCDISTLIDQAEKEERRRPRKLKDRTVEELQAIMERAVKKERYEQAARIQKLIRQKTAQNPDDDHGNEE